MSDTANAPPYGDDLDDDSLLAQLLGMATEGRESATDNVRSETPSVATALPGYPMTVERRVEETVGATDSSTTRVGPRKGRKAIPSIFIENEDPRAVTFCKRKDGIVKKSNEVACMTGCSVILVVQQVPTDRPVNTYIHASSTWRSVPFSEAFRQLISTVHQPRRDAAYSPNRAYEENVFGLPEGSRVGNEYVCIQDRPSMSSSSDVYCVISAGSERQYKPDNSPSSSSVPRTPSCDSAGPRTSVREELDYSEDEDDIERSYFESCLLPTPQPQKRKREYSTTTIIQDQRTREICFSKRKEGLFKKVRR